MSIEPDPHPHRTPPSFIPLVGYPIGQVLTPPLFNAHFERTGQGTTMIPVELLAGQAGNFFAALRGWTNCLGCSITIPHKQAAFAAVDQRTPRAERAGAVNFLRRTADGLLVGDMTDGLAMTAAITQAGIDLKGARVALAGAAGGAGGAIADALCESGIAALTLIDPQVDKCAVLAGQLKTRYPEVAISTSHGAQPLDVAINASPMGMNAGDPYPLDLDLLKPRGAVADVVTKPVMTPLLLEAARRGHTIVRGDQMAAAQLPFQLAHLDSNSAENQR
ncbi:MAG: shikimate dehydrogenase [Devosia sp.]|uniref:shikimate dehydrogenase family protein n=1 Tax=Devosia sp. TaxID=1871048 RepID=UPI0024CB1E7B|nr:shikimate dehydrogenase [Devosia sp.]UYO00280.1 MAG: shikimate dehydrogenase [Devosia sp.]